MQTQHGRQNADHTLPASGLRTSLRAAAGYRRSATTFGLQSHRTASRRSALHSRAEYGSPATPLARPIPGGSRR